MIVAAFLTFIDAAYDISSPKIRIPIIPLISVHEIFHHRLVMTHGGVERINFSCKNRLQSIYTSIVCCVHSLKTHTFFSVICGVSLFVLCALFTSVQHLLAA